MGAQRWYLLPLSLTAKALESGAIPDEWGVLGYDGRCVRVVRAVDDVLCDRTTASLRNEIRLLVSIIRRYQAQGITYQTITGRAAEYPLFEETTSAGPAPEEP